MPSWLLTGGHRSLAGCCKTRLARATATASGARLHALNGAQVYSSYVGEGEARLRAAFKRARAVAPAILFLDELDALIGERSPVCCQPVRSILLMHWLRPSPLQQSLVP